MTKCEECGLSDGSHMSDCPAVARAVAAMPSSILESAYQANFKIKDQQIRDLMTQVDSLRAQLKWFEDREAFMRDALTAVENVADEREPNNAFENIAKCIRDYERDNPKPEGP